MSAGGKFGTTEGSAAGRDSCIAAGEAAGAQAAPGRACCGGALRRYGFAARGWRRCGEQRRRRNLQGGADGTWQHWLAGYGAGGRGGAPQMGREDGTFFCWKVRRRSWKAGWSRGLVDIVSGDALVPIGAELDGHEKTVTWLHEGAENVV
jgi:hypothetical protein